MKKLVLGTLLLSIALAFWPYSAMARETSGPKRVLDHLEDDFKTVKEGTPVEHTFKVLNKGDEILKIIRVRPG